MRGADTETFRFYLNGFAKDKKNCYFNESRLAGGNGANFRALNYTYVTDGQSVWTLGGKVKDADAATFEGCDRGWYDVGGGCRVPYGFGKDKERVFYYDFNGKPNWVRKATAATFVSLKDGVFGKDHQYVFRRAVTLPKANVKTWHKLGSDYSKDDKRIYYCNRLMPNADYDTFEVIGPEHTSQNMAKDINCLLRYRPGKSVKRGFEEILREFPARKPQ